MNMSNQRPDVTDEDIGMRTFQLRKAQAVERAIDRLRQGMKADWAHVHRARDRGDLAWILGELWAYVARADWDDLHFSKLTHARRRGRSSSSRASCANHTRNSVEVLERRRTTSSRSKS